MGTSVNDDAVQPGGEVYNYLLLTGQVRPAQNKRTREASSESSRSTSMTRIKVPKRVSDRVGPVAVQLYHQEKLASQCGRSFAYFSSALDKSEKLGVIDKTERQLLNYVGGNANYAKHHEFGGPAAVPDSDEEFSVVPVFSTFSP